MNDMYKEVLVKPQPKATDGLKKGLLIAAVVVLAAAGVLIWPLFLLLAIVLGVLEVWLIFPRFSVEYEYLYINGDIDIDAIYNKTSRKKQGSFEKGSLEVMAPSGSAHLDGYAGGKDAKVLDYTSGEGKAKVWTLVYGSASGRKVLLLELPDEVAQDMRRHAPQKVFFQ